jgi:hypothetical protein
VQIISEHTMTNTKHRTPLWRIVLRLAGYVSTAGMFVALSNLDLNLAELEACATLACAPAVAALLDLTRRSDVQSC